MKTFDVWMRMGRVRNISPDASLSASLVKSSGERLAFAAGLALTEKSSKYVFEEAYESIRECIDALLARDGYKTDSHEAAIAYLAKKSRGTVSMPEIARIDAMRSMRIGSKYYGRNIPVGLTKEALGFSKSVLPRIAALAKN
jgi:hypothetical protein